MRGMRPVGEHARLEAVDAAVARGIADAEAGRLKPLREVFERLQSKYTALEKGKGQ